MLLMLLLLMLLSMLPLLLHLVAAGVVCGCLQWTMFFKVCRRRLALAHPPSLSSRAAEPRALCTGSGGQLLVPSRMPQGTCHHTPLDGSCVWLLDSVGHSAALLYYGVSVPGQVSSQQRRMCVHI
jgi:hypothetical protein